MVKTQYVEITGQDVGTDLVAYPYANKNRMTLLGMNKGAGLTDPEVMILPGRDITIEMKSDAASKSDVVAVRFNWNGRGSNSGLSVLVYADPQSSYAAFTEKTERGDRTINYNGATLTPIMHLTVAYDAGIARMEVFDSECFQKFLPCDVDSLLLAAPLLKIAQKLVAGQSIDLRQELKGTPYEAALPSPVKNPTFLQKVFSHRAP